MESSTLRATEPAPAALLAHCSSSSTRPSSSVRSTILSCLSPPLRTQRREDRGLPNLVLWKPRGCSSLYLEPRPWGPLLPALFLRRLSSGAYSPECEEGGFSEVRTTPVQPPCRLGRPDVTERADKTRLTTSYLLTLRAVAGCATGSIRPTTMTDVTATASGEGHENIGLSAGASDMTITDVTATASGADFFNQGMNLLGGTDVAIRQSKMSGTTAALFKGNNTSNLFKGNNTSNISVALSQLVGPIQAQGTLQCFNNYDENLAAVTCPQ